MGLVTQETTVAMQGEAVRAEGPCMFCVGRESASENEDRGQID